MKATGNALLTDSTKSFNFNKIGNSIQAGNDEAILML